MKTNEKKVVFLNEVKSPYIEQAIFVLKNTREEIKVNGGIVEEAERIVAQYAKQHFPEISIEEDHNDPENMSIPTFEFSAFSRPSRLRIFMRQNRTLLWILALSLLSFIGLISFMGCIL